MNRLLQDIPPLGSKRLVKSKIDFLSDAEIKGGFNDSFVKRQYIRMKMRRNFSGIRIQPDGKHGLLVANELSQVIPGLQDFRHEGY